MKCPECSTEDNFDELEICPAMKRLTCRVCSCEMLSTWVLGEGERVVGYTAKDGKFKLFNNFIKFGGDL